ncbi:replication initiation factor domain-containing protein [Methylovorus sp. MM2]|uniref:replication initiation factor domain-containing protein n=1 Tax=Methylovorus sp. MM2 TaxID=1848038 RepID=UPI0009EF0B12|nr:replication initiation factor domain-containing protein [Methylovorus sp. MM2]
MKKKTILPFADVDVILRATLTAEYFSRIRQQTQNTEEQGASHVQAEERPQRSEDAPQAVTPTSNTGGKKINLVCEGGKAKQLLQRVHSENEVCFIDWLNVTCHESSFMWGARTVIDDEQLIMEVSSKCESIFGFGITAKRDRGANFYRTSFVLGDKYGLVCYGGQRNTVLIMLNGEGCTAAQHGWERRFYEFLQVATTPRITRIDLAHDDIEGKTFTMESLEKSYEDGAFNNGGRNPDNELRGNWKNPNGKGRTIYVGRRTNGRFFRGYEKGCQLGSPTSPWVRLEVEFKSVDRFLPFDILLRPQDYFSAAYPILINFSEKAERIFTTQKTVEVSYERTKTWLKHQCGSALNLMFQIEESADKVLGLVMREGKIPKGITVPSYLTAGEFLHNLAKTVIPAGYIDETFERY